MQCDLRLGDCPPLSAYITLISAFTTASQCVYFTHAFCEHLGRGEGGGGIPAEKLPVSRHIIPDQFFG
jgi:hypothetical protein